MMLCKVVLGMAASLLFSCCGGMAQSALPTATQPLEISGFGGLSGVWTGLAGGTNLDVLAGADLGLPPVRHVRPELEVRGVYPLDQGNVDGQKSILGGIKADFLLHNRLRPYGDFLLGRGEVRYSSPGYQVGNVIYQLSTTNVYSFGGGFDEDLTPRLGVRVDAQVQRWGYAPTASGNMYPRLVTVALVCRLGFDRQHRK